MAKAGDSQSRPYNDFDFVARPFSLPYFLITLLELLLCPQWLVSPPPRQRIGIAFTQIHHSQLTPVSNSTRMMRDKPSTERAKVTARPSGVHLGKLS